MAQQKLCLKWNNHTINLLAVLENFQSRDILVDVTLSCEGRNIKAHKMVLSACSPYFQNIFLENPCQHPIVIINGMKYEDITAILNFMYKGEVNVSHEGLSSFLQAAEALKVKGLAEVCGDRRGSNSNSQEAEPSEPARPQRTDTPTKKRPRNRKRSFSDSNRSDDEGAPRKHKEINSPEVHELSGDESYTGDMSSNGQPLNSRVPQNVYSRSHQSSSNITPDDMEDEYEVEPSKMLEQTLTENANNSTSSDNGLRIERIVGNAPEMESSSLQEPESPPDIKPIIEYGESSAGPSEGNMLVYNEQSQPGPSNIQDGSLLHDNSHTQVERVKKKVPFNHIMRKVVFTLSGFVNPMRDELRRKALYMGATYKRDWDSTCTHLVSAFPNTPKYIQARSEDGRVVTKKWITDCYKMKICLPWRDYRLGSYDSGTSGSDDSETDEEFDIRTKQKNTVQTNGTAMEISDSGSEVEDELKTYMAIKNVDSGSGGDTEDEIRKIESKIKKEKLDESPSKETTSEAVNIKSEKPSIDDLPKLTNLFKQKQFFLYGNFSSSITDLQNLITAYNGVVKGYLSGDVKYVITEAKWNSSFDEALCMNEDLIFVKPLWIYKCHESKKYVPYQPYIIIPDL